MSDETTVSVRIDSLSYGRAAVGRIDGKVAFVEGAAPGDLVVAEVLEDRGTYLEAKAVEIVEPGPGGH